MNAHIAKTLDQTLTGNVFEYFKTTENLIEGNSGVHDNKCLSLDAYDPPCPVQKGIYTKVKITDESVDIINMDKSTISARLWFKLNFNALAGALNDEYTAANDTQKKAITIKNRGIYFFVGFKASSHFFDGYRIYSNGKKTACEQTEALYENAFQRMLKAQEELDEKPYVYTTWEMANKRDDSICGTYVTAEDIRTGVSFNGRTPQAGVVELMFEVIVPLDDFLPLSAMTMFPSCAFGNLTMELKLAIQNNLVMCQCDPQVTYDRNLLACLTSTEIEKDTFAKCADLAHSNVLSNAYSHAFAQISDSFNVIMPMVKAWTQTDEIEQLRWDSVSLSADCVAGTILEMRSNLNGFNIKDSVRSKIINAYTSGYYIIPAQFVDYQAFSQPPSGRGTTRCNTTYALTNCTGMGLLFPRTQNELTCARNPHLAAVQLQVDNKPFPDKPFSTHDTVHASYCMTNAGFDGLFSCSREYGHSLRFRETQNIKEYDGTHTLVTSDTPEDNTSYCLYCATERLCGYGTYCDGLTKDSAQISLSMTLEHQSPYSRGQPPVLLILQDCFWKCSTSGVEFVYNNGSFAEENAASATVEEF